MPHQSTGQRRHPTRSPAESLALSSAFSVISEGVLSPDQLDAVNSVIAVSGNRERMHVVQGPTAFGKTRVGLALVDLFRRRDYTILWVAKKWRLLKQATDELTGLFPRHQPSLRRLGGDNECLQHLPTDGRGRIFFTTLETWRRRKDKNQLPNQIRRSNKMLVIWDECHWAVNAPTGDQLLNFYVKRHPRFRCGNSLLVGLSATPKCHKSGRITLAWGIPYIRVLGVRVAYPLHKNIETGAVWDPIVKNHVVSQHSLNEIAVNVDRNKTIVNELLRGRHEGRYTKIIVFACNIKHATTLQTMIAEGGAPSRSLHSRLSKRTRDLAVEKFRNNEVDVLVNVNQFAEGDNVPDIDAVFIARPTTSKVLMRQMIGRGSRLADGKTHFTVVEFTDIIRQHAEEFYHASQLIDDETNGHPGIGRYRYIGPVRHEEPDHPQVENVFFPELGNMVFVRNQTFGVEIELTSPGEIPHLDGKWRDTAKEILARLRECACAEVHPEPLHYHENDNPAKWVVEHDSSAGWEIVSPILKNAEGLHELRRVCEGLTNLVRSHAALHINHRTGLHVTLATRLNTDNRLRGFLKRLQRLEPGLMTLVSSSRLFRFDGRRYHINDRNTFCLPVRETIQNADAVRLSTFALDHDNRYHSVNLTHAYDDIEKLEIRLHNGTTEFRKIASWISLWMLIFNRARYAWSGNGVYAPVFAGGDCHISSAHADKEDIFKLLAAEEIFLSQDIVRVLHERRRELRDSWARALPERVESWDHAGWYSSLDNDDTTPRASATSNYSAAVSC